MNIYKWRHNALLPSTAEKVVNFRFMAALELIHPREIITGVVTVWPGFRFGLNVLTSSALLPTRKFSQVTREEQIRFFSRHPQVRKKSSQQRQLLERPGLEFQEDLSKTTKRQSRWKRWASKKRLNQVQHFLKV